LVGLIEDGYRCVVISVLVEAAMSVRLGISAALTVILATGGSLAAGPTDAALLDAARAANWSSVRLLPSKVPQREAVNVADAYGKTRAGEDPMAPFQ
jgi:hypothetical protein